MTRQFFAHGSLLALIVTLVLLFTGQMAIMNVKGVSMNPNLYEGDLVLVWKQGDYQTGDAVAYKASWGDHAGAPVLHRITREKPEGWVLQGDNNKAEDPQVVTHDLVVGKLVGAVPGAGAIIESLRSSVWTWLIAGTVLIYGWPQKSKQPEKLPAAA